MAEVTALENKMFEMPAMSGLAISKAARFKFPFRPTFAKDGDHCTVFANYVDIKPSKDLVLHRYDISVQPDCVGRKRVRLVQLLINEAPELVGLRNDIVSDFKSTLISRTQITDNEATIEVVYRNEGEDELDANSTRFKVKIQHTNTLDMSDFMAYLTSTDPNKTYDAKLPMIQAFNIFLNHHVKATPGLATIGANKTFSVLEGQGGAERWRLGQGLTAIRGFFTSVRPATARLLVNVNVTHGAFRNEGPLEDLMKEVYYSSRNLVTLSKFLEGVRVKVNHLPVRRNRQGQVLERIKTIRGLASERDGCRLARPPRVEFFGAGAAKVRFWNEAEGHNGEAGYVSVDKYLRRSKSSGGGGHTLTGLEPCADDP